VPIDQNRLIESMSFPQFFRGLFYKTSVGKPKIAVHEWDIPSLYTETKYNDYEKYYKETSLVRQCIDLRAAFTTAKGFHTEIEVLDEKLNPDDFAWVKKVVDETNRRIDMDNILYLSEIKREVFGFVLWEVVKTKQNKKPKITRLNPLEVDQTTPVYNDDGVLEHFTYGGEATKLELEDAFYISGVSFSANPMGLSLVEPIVPSVKQQRELDEDVLAVAMRMWAPFIILQVDTLNMSDEQETSTMTSLKDAAQPGVNLVVNKSVESTVVHMTPDMQSLSTVRRDIDETIIGNFTIPKALLGREKTLNRATLEASLQALRESAISRIQRTLKRAVEHQIYDRICEYEGVADKVRIRHVWNPISIQDFKELSGAITDMYKAKAIDQKTLFELLAIDKLLMAGDTASFKATKKIQQTDIEKFPSKPKSTTSGTEQEVKLE
jgi:hypothetical protein